MKQFIIFLLVLFPVCSFAQFAETFDGPEINSTNPWKGDLDIFSLSGDGWLFFDYSGRSDTCRLYAPITFSSNMEWEAKMRFSFSPTSYNKLHLYVYRTGQPSDVLYFIRVTDVVSLYKWPPKGEAKQLIKGQRKVEKDTDIHIKLVLENNSQWTLYTRLGSEDSFQEEGTCKVSMEDLLDGANLNLSCICRAKSYKNYHLLVDELLVRNELTDTSGTSTDNPDESDTSDEESGDEEDGSGEEGSEDVTAGSVLINEVMADPKGLTNLPETEYVELHNTTSNSITLSGWQFSYGGSAKEMTTFVIPAGGYAVLYRSGRDIEIDAEATDVPLDNFPSKLANDGKELKLLNSAGEVIDEYSYPKATPARSWERGSSGDWHLSSDPRGGTPGAANSSGADDEGDGDQDQDPEQDQDQEQDTLGDIVVEPSEIIFNELLPEPYTDGSEYIELYNRSDRQLSLSGLSVAVRKTDGTLNTRYPLSSITSTIEPGGYALLTKNLSGVTGFYTILSQSSLFEVSKLPILANTSSTLVLFRTADGTIIDEVAYSSSWHASSVKNRKGVALERIDPEAETQLADNWTSASATAGYGTPGYQNSQASITGSDDSQTTTGIQPPKWDDGQGYYILPYDLDEQGYNCRAFVFNLAGARVAEIANNELLGTSGKLTWNGESSSGKRLPAGVYIFYAELYNTDGVVKKYKKVFLVR